jgi:hypothetical protein
MQHRGTDTEPQSPCERLDEALAGIAMVTDELTVAFKEVDRLATRWSLFESIAATPVEPSGS